MPYDPDNPPKKIRKLSAKKQRQWVHVFNSAVERGADEESAHKQAWSAVKKEAVLDSLNEFCVEVSKMAPVSVPGTKQTLRQRRGGVDASQWHEIPSEPGVLRRVVGGEVERKPKREGAKKPAPGKKKPVAGAKLTRYENLPATTGYSEAKVDQKTGKLVVTGRSGRGRPLPRVLIDLDDPKLDEKLPAEWKRHLRRIASELNIDDHFEHLRKAALFELKNFSLLLVGEEKVEKKDDKKKKPKVVDVSTPAGARAMALGLSRLFGGWNGGCRLSPSANRVDTYHVTVFCETPQELGQRILDLKAHLLAQGYKEESEGIFRNGNRTVYQGRSYSRRKGKRPLAFMLTVRSKNN
jgi:cation transport regulator ChaB